MHTLPIPLSTIQQDQLQCFIAQLQRWNKAQNLVGNADTEHLLTRHIADSLAIVPWVQGPRIADVGSGAGFPGIPLAIAKPECDVVLIESREKRCFFLENVIAQCGLSNVSVTHGRVEAVQPDNYFDTITCRAFASLSDFLRLSQHLGAANSLFLAMKSTEGLSEIHDIPSNFVVKSTKEYTLADGRTHHAVIITVS